MLIERFEYLHGNNCNVDLRDCRIEVRSKIEAKGGLIRLNIEIFDKVNNQKIAMLQRFLKGK